MDENEDETFFFSSEIIGGTNLGLRERDEIHSHSTVEFVGKGLQSTIGDVVS